MFGKKLLGILLVFLAAFSVTLSVACAGEKEQTAQRTVAPTSTTYVQATTHPAETPTQRPTVTVPPAPTNTPAPTVPKEVYVTSSDGLRVRAGPGLGYDKIKTEPLNSAGTIIEGPVATDGYLWLRVRYTDGTDGWSAQDYLAFGKVPAATEVPRAAPAQHVCDFRKPITLRPATTYDIFGTDAYDTLVCGYVTMVYEEHGGESGQVPITIPYFVIVDYADPGFIQAVDAGIRQGNGVNRKGPQYYEFNLGCYKDGKIVGEVWPDSNIYMDQATQAALLNSSPDNLVSLVLSFGYHGGRGCDCCNLAHEVRSY